jgi:hypothetical protein
MEEVTDNEKVNALLMYKVSVGQCILMLGAVELGRSLKCITKQDLGESVRYKETIESVYSCIKTSTGYENVINSIKSCAEISSLIDEYKEEFTFLSKCYKDFFFVFLKHPKVGIAFFKLKKSVEDILKALKKRDKTNKRIEV